MLLQFTRYKGEEEYCTLYFRIQFKLNYYIIVPKTSCKHKPQLKRDLKK